MQGWTTNWDTRASGGEEAVRDLVAQAHRLLASGWYDAASAVVERLRPLPAAASALGEIEARLAFARTDTPPGDEIKAALFGLLVREGPFWLRSSEIVLVVGHVARREGISSALKLLNSVIAAGAADWRLLVQRSVLQCKLHDYPEARRSICAAWQAAPSSEKPEVALVTARIQSISDQLDYAAATLDAYILKMVPNAQFYYRAARIYEAAGQPGRAYYWADRAHGMGLQVSAVCRFIAENAFAIGNLAVAQSMAAQVVAAHPEDLGAQVLLARTHVAQEHFLVAGDVLLPLVASYPEDVRLRLLLAQVFEGLGHPEEAEKQLHEAVKLAPNDMEARLNLAGFLIRRGEQVKAAEQCAVLEQDGKLDEQVQLRLERYSVRAKATVPDDDDQIRAALQKPIPKAFLLIEAEVAPHRRHSGSWWLALSTHWAVVHATLMREVVSRFGRHKLGYFWAFAEPALSVGVFWLIFTITGHAKVMEMSPPLFLVTGFLPYSLFQNTYARVLGMTKASAGLISHPQVKLFDILVARAVLEAATLLAVFFIFLLGLFVAGDRIVIGSPLTIIGGLGMLWAFGIGLGLIVEALSSLFPSVLMIFNVLIRIMFFSSGLFFSPVMLPPQAREFFLYNPLLHMIEIVRLQFTVAQPYYGLDPTYAALWSLILLAGGLTLERVLRQRSLQG